MKGVASFLQYLAEINAEVTILYNFYGLTTNDYSIQLENVMLY